jgi:hypothetical protein
MRPWLIWGTVAWLISGCPLEPLTVTGFGVSSSVIRPGGTGSGSLVTVSVPGIRGTDTAGLTASLNGVPVPVVASRDGEVSIRMPAGWQGDVARFDLWRNGERVTSRDIAALLAQGAKVSPTDSVTVRTNGETTSSTPVGSGGVTINITVPAGSTTGGGGTTVVTSGGTDTGSGSGSSGTPTASPTPVPPATPVPTPTPAATPTPAPTLVPVADQTPVPGGTGEVQGHVQF